MYCGATWEKRRYGAASPRFDTDYTNSREQAMTRRSPRSLRRESRALRRQAVGRHVDATTREGLLDRIEMLDSGANRSDHVIEDRPEEIRKKIKRRRRRQKRELERDQLAPPPPGRPAPRRRSS